MVGVDNVHLMYPDCIIVYTANLLNDSENISVMTGYCCVLM